MTDEEKENYFRCMWVLELTIGTLARIKDEGLKMAKTTGFPDFTGIATETLEQIYPIMDEIYEFNNRATLETDDESPT